MTQGGEYALVRAMDAKRRANILMCMRRLGWHMPGEVRGVDLASTLSGRDGYNRMGARKARS
jgi:hypothetical protein